MNNFWTYRSLIPQCRLHTLSSHPATAGPHTRACPPFSAYILGWLHFLMCSGACFGSAADGAMKPKGSSLRRFTRSGGRPWPRPNQHAGLLSDHLLPIFSNSGKKIGAHVSALSLVHAPRPNLPYRYHVWGFSMDGSWKKKGSRRIPTGRKLRCSSPKIAQHQRILTSLISKSPKLNPNICSWWEIEL
jgi:hypothetical protein